MKGKCVYPLDEIGKKCSDSTMENNNEINKKIAKNLIQYRKAAGLTQAELAEKINYSDKSVSKWESGNGMPDVYTLLQLAELYGVTLNDFVGEKTAEKPDKKKSSFHFWIMLLSSGIVWLVATCFFVMALLWLPGDKWWLSFLYAVAVNAIVIIVFAAIWKHRILHFLAVSVLIWSAITCLYLTVSFILAWRGIDQGALWVVFLVGVPLQVLECMWGLFRSRLGKHKKEAAPSAEKAVKAEIEKSVEKEAERE